MSTIDYQLNILRDTQMVQRRLLEKMFPYIDWARMPFSSYGDFFRLRGILDDCGAVWTNAYGRSNEEDSSTRKYLTDYSGKGRDIELFNFGYSKQSGFNGYVQDFRNWNTDVNPAVSYIISENSVNITNGQGSGATWTVGCYKNSYVNKEWRCYVKKSQDATITAIDTETLTNVKIVHLTEGLNTIPAFTEEEYSAASIIYITVSSEGGTLLLTQIPSYQGALVSDGVDDYGQCVKDFALPDDYTVVAMRERLGNPATLIGKNLNPGGASAFDFETGTGSTGTDKYDCQSYGGARTRLNTYPKLFSYQTKTSYNGIEIAVGTSTDTEAASLTVFKSYVTSSYHVKAALYSFGIFTRTLTKEELRVVENCMYAEWICMTGKLEDIEYYDILDARFRSNSEDADKRNRWVGRFGKLHMTLNNYGYSENSGWGGWGPYDLSKWTLVGEDVSVVGSRMTINKSNGAFSAYLNTTSAGRFTIKVYGVTQLVERGEIIGLHPMFRMSTSGISNDYALPLITKDGVYSKDLTFSGKNDGIGFVVTTNISSPITIELLPDYGGALVSDGVDDYAVSDEVIDEEIGGVVAHAELLGGTYLFAANYTQNTLWGYKYNDFLRLGDAVINDSQISATNIQSDKGVFAYSREPGYVTGNLYIARARNDSNPEWGQNALYQLRLIKTQPTDIQLEAIKWQCRKEHDDYLIHMGWKEVE